MSSIRSGLTARDLEPGSWDLLARRGFHRHAWFRLAESNGQEPRHVALFEREQMKAVFPAFRQDRVLHGDFAERWLGPLGFWLRPSLAVVLPFGQSSEPLGAAEIAEDELHAVFEQLEETARRDRARAIVLPWLDSDLPALRRVARARGYVAAFAGSTAALDIAWDSFDAYVRSRGKRVRRTIRLELEELARLGVRVTQETDLGRLAPEIDALYRRWYRWRNGRDPALPLSFFGDLAAIAGDSLGVQITRIDGRLVAASVWAEARGVLDAGFVSFADHELGSVYFNELIYAPVRLACERGFTRLELGPTSLAPKMLRGATIRPRITLVRGTSRALHGAIAVLARVVSARNRRKERK